MSSIVVAVCTRNPRRAYLDRVLGALSSQTLPVADWSLVVIDNQSEPPVASIADLSWHPSSRVVREERLGLTWARLTAIRETTEDLIVFVDDDNIVANDYLESALDVLAKRPFVGAFSGSVKAELEATPPDWFRPYRRLLAIRDVETERWSNDPAHSQSMPSGAGMCVIRKVAERYVHLHESGARPVILGRMGDALQSSEDEDLAACSCDIGMGIGVFPSLSLTHLIPAARLAESYLLSVAEGIAFSHAIRLSYRGSPVLRRPMRSRIADVLRAATYSRIERKMLLAEIRGRERARDTMATQR